MALLTKTVDVSVCREQSLQTLLLNVDHELPVVVLLCFVFVQANLSAEQKKELKSISGMGFPSPRVARALLKCEGDKTKVTMPSLTVFHV